MATWVLEVESEFFNRWLVVGVPLGGQQLVSQVLLALFITQEASGAESQAVLARRAPLSRCIILLTSQTCTPPPIHTRRAFPPSDCVPALIRRHLPLSPLPRLISLPLCSPPEHDFNSDSINPRCGSALWPNWKWAHTEEVKFSPVFT